MIACATVSRRFMEWHSLAECAAGRNSDFSAQEPALTLPRRGRKTKRTSQLLLSAYTDNGKPRPRGNRMLPLGKTLRLFDNGAAQKDFSENCSPVDQRQARIGFLPGIPNPHVAGIFRYGKGARTPGQEVQVINVVSRSGNHGVISAAHQYNVAVHGPQC